MSLNDEVSSLWTFAEELIELISPGVRDNAFGTTLATPGL